MPFIWVLRENKNSPQEKIIGCIKGVIDEKRQIVEIGPVAVRPDYQVRNIHPLHSGYKKTYNIMKKKI